MLDKSGEAGIVDKNIQHENLLLKFSSIGLDDELSILFKFADNLDKSHSLIFLLLLAKISTAFNVFVDSFTIV